MATNTNITLSKIYHRAMDVNILSKALLYTKNTNVSVGSSGTSILVANTGRKCATFVNDSDETIYLFLSHDAPSTGMGIRLNAEGGSYEINVTNLYNGAVSAICTSGSKNLCITEGYEGFQSSDTINSNAWVLYETSKTLNSNSFIRELAQSATINSNAFNKKLAATKTIDSNGFNKVLATAKTLNSNSYIKASTSKTLNSNGHIFKTESKTIASDLFIGYTGKSPASILQWAVIVE